MADVTFTVTASSHPDFQFFGDLRFGTRQARAFRMNTMAEVEQRIAEVEASFDALQTKRLESGQSSLTIEIVRDL